MRIELPWPNRGLSPNARIHWAPLSKLKLAARESAAWYAKTFIPLAARQAIAAGEGPIRLAIVFYPPDRRHRDDDNMVGSFKAYRDGIADALGVDDRRFRPHYFFRDAEKPGRVEVEFLSELSTPAGASECSPSVLHSERAGSLRKQLPGPDQNDEVTSHGS